MFEEYFYFIGSEGFFLNNNRRSIRISNGFWWNTETHKFDAFSYCDKKILRSEQKKTNIVKMSFTNCHLQIYVHTIWERSSSPQQHFSHIVWYVSECRSISIIFTHIHLYTNDDSCVLSFRIWNLVKNGSGGAKMTLSRRSFSRFL